MELPAPRRRGARRGNGAVALAAAAVVAVSAVFALGLALGQRKDQVRAASVPEAVPDRLAALDRAEVPTPAPAATQATYVFHDALTKDRPPDTLAQVGHAPTPAVKPGTAVTTARAAPPAASPAAKPASAAPAKVASAAQPAPRPSSAAPQQAARTVATSHAPVKPAAPAAQPVVKAPSAPLPAAAPAAPHARGWTIQLVATPKESEAQRLAAKHPGSRVVAAEIDGKRWYRVQLGSWDSRSGAQAELPRVARPGAFVTLR